MKKENTVHINNTGLKVRDGGQRLNIENSNHHFISAYVTDTRLMGVLAVYAHWHIDNFAEDMERQPNVSSVTWGDLHQFFYIDCEESGIETYSEIRVSDPDEVERLEQSIIGGLGAKKVDLDEARLRSLMSIWKKYNEDHKLPLPEGKAHYDFIFSDGDTPDDGDAMELMAHICPTVKTDYQLINFFLMRCFGNDPEGVAFLTDKKHLSSSSSKKPSVDPAIYGRYFQATMWRNVIDKKPGTEGEGKEYLCEPIVEMNGNYEQIISLITVKDLKVIGIECRGTSPISSTEAALVMKRSEFVTVYDLLLSEEEIENNIDEFTIGFHMTMSETENGRLFLSYRPNNDHVDRRIFQLNADVNGLLFLTVNGQLILSAYSEEDAQALEKKLHSSVLKPHLLITGKFEFKNPVLYEFMHSSIDYFETFLQLLRGE